MSPSISQSNPDNLNADGNDDIMFENITDSDRGDSDDEAGGDKDAKISKKEKKK